MVWIQLKNDKSDHKRVNGRKSDGINIFGQEKMIIYNIKNIK